MSKPKVSSTSTKGSTPSTSSSAKPSTQGWTSVYDMPLEELQRRTEQAVSLMQQGLDMLPGLTIMTIKERKRSTGRFRSGEGPIYLDIISVMEAFPAFFEGLADLDEGRDPNKVETELMRDRIQRAELLAPLGGLVEKFVGISDTVLHLRSQVRQPVIEAYGIAKSLARTNTAIRSKLVKALDYYARIANTAAATRRANATAKPLQGSGGAGSTANG